MTEIEERAWWDRWRVLLPLILLLAVPLLWPTVPPLNDLPAHMGRYRIMLEGPASPLAVWYAIDWRPIGNLGVDLAVLPLARAIGLEPAVKAVVTAIPVLTGLGFILVARAAHGRVPPTAAFALPLAYGYPFQFGFVNFAMAMALALVAFSLWLRLAQAGRWRLRGVLFVLIAPVIWVAHVFGWAVLCLLCGMAELVRYRRAGQGWPVAAMRAAVACLPVMPPVLLMLIWRSVGPAAETALFFDWQSKRGWLESVLRDRWVMLDGASAALLAGLMLLGAVRVLRFDRALLVGAGALAAAYLLLPKVLIGSFYADMRLAPFLVALSVLALAPRVGTPRWMQHGLAVAACAFCLVRIGAATASLAIQDRAITEQTAAIPHIPRGARVLVLVALPCVRGWGPPRIDHVGSLALVRRGAFVNDQFADPGAQPLRVRGNWPADWTRSPSQVVRVGGCARAEPLLDDRLARFPRALFDHVWLIGVASADRPVVADLTPLWASPVGALYRVRRLPPPPRGPARP
ncbi:hypothetical protein [Sphingomonas montana]|uniref:hypothetical protein n=1 Tax=Sphingomonas montana TaxID=1843236 RepID=UPI0009F96AC4|nr:hypothetical protein [Sphingomonas montana]